jgi:exopolysaccharide biosynthesis protein
MSKYTRLGKNTLFVFIGNIGGKVLTFLMLPFYTRWLSATDFGTVDILITYATFLFGIVTLSISESVFIFPKDKTYRDQQRYFSSGLFYTFLHFIAIGVLIIIYILFADNTIGNVFTNNLWFIYLLIFTMYLQSYFQQFARAIDRMKVYSISGVVLSFSIVVNSFIFIPKYGVTGYILTWSISYFTTAFYSLYYSGAFEYLSFNGISARHYKQMLKYAIPLIPNGVMFWLMNSLNRPLLEKYCGLDTVGIYAVANKFPLMLSTIFNVFLFSWHITVLEEYEKKDYPYFFNRILRYVVLALCTIFIVISLLNKPVIMILASAEFYNAWKYISLLTLGSLILSLSAFVGGNFLATKNSKYFLYSSVLGALCSVILNFILIPLWGIYGAAVSIIIAYLVMLFSRLYYIHSTVKVYGKFKYLMMLCILFLFSVTVGMNESIIKYLFVIMEIAILLYLNKDLNKDYHVVRVKIENFIKNKFK